MADLSDLAVDKYWTEKSLVLKELLYRMADRQDWVVDEELSNWLLALSDALGSKACESRMVESPEDTLKFLAWLSTPKALRILNAIEEYEVGFAAQLIVRAEEMAENPVFRLFVEGLEMLSRVRLLSHIFSPDRLALVEAAVRAAKEGRTL